MFRDVSPQMAGLVSNWCTTILYGVALVIYAICMYVLIGRRRERSKAATWILIGTSTLQILLSTIHAALALVLLIEGFIQTQNIPGGAFLYWINPSTKAQVITKAVYIGNSIVGDSVLIWRVYMVWGQNIYVCILPIIITCCATVTGFINIRQLAAITGVLMPTSIFEILKWVLATWCLSIATQVISTGLIAFKIWKHARLNPVAKSRYMSIIAIILESGAIYTVSTAFLMALADRKTQAGAIPGDMTAQLATIVPTLIIVRVGLSRSKNLDTLDMRGADGAARMDILRHQSLRHGSSSSQGDSSVHITVSTLTASDSLQEIKYAV